MKLVFPRSCSSMVVSLTTVQNQSQKKKTLAPAYAGVHAQAHVNSCAYTHMLAAVTLVHSIMSCSTEYLF